MKRLAILLAVAPAAVSAHGLHPPDPTADVAAHSAMHFAPVIAVVALIGLVAWMRRIR